MLVIFINTFNDSHTKLFVVCVCVCACVCVCVCVDVEGHG